MLRLTDHREELIGRGVDGHLWFGATRRLRLCRLRIRKQQRRQPRGSRPPLAAAAHPGLCHLSRGRPVRDREQLPFLRPMKAHLLCDAVASASAALPRTPARRRLLRRHLLPQPTRTFCLCPLTRLLMRWSLPPPRQHRQQLLPLPLGCVRLRGVFLQCQAAAVVLKPSGVAARQRALMLVPRVTGGLHQRQEREARPTRGHRLVEAAQRIGDWRMLWASAAPLLEHRHRVPREPRRPCARAWTGSSRGRSATAPKYGALMRWTTSAIMVAAVADRRLHRSGRLRGLAPPLVLLTKTMRRGPIGSIDWVLQFQ